MESPPPLWKASGTLRKTEAADVIALFQLTPPLPRDTGVSDCS
jgi:hypothetical protein